MSYFSEKAYDNHRAKPLEHYVAAQTAYLKTLHPEYTDEQIRSFVKEVVRKRVKVPTVRALVHPSEGNTNEVTMGLDRYTVKVIGQNLLSPSGTCYMPVSQKESFLRISIKEKVAARNHFKKLYLEFEEKNQRREAAYYNQNQANAKIFNNAIAGGMNITQFILGDKAGFNAITSVARISVKQGYSYIERAVNGNLYLPNVRAAISYIFNHVRSMNPEFESALYEFGLYIPNRDDVAKYLITNIENYVYKPDATLLLKVIDNLSDTELAYVFYVANINNLLRFNDKKMRGFIDQCFDNKTIPEDLSHIELSEIKTFSKDVACLLLATCYKHLGLKPGKTNEWNSPKDAVENNPDGLRKFIWCGRVFINAFTPYVKLLKSIMQTGTTFQGLIFHNKMARYTVPLSDTDSNIYSTQELVEWRRGKVDFDQESYEMNALVTFLLSQSLEHVFALFSANIGCEGQDVFEISMKNEFLYPVVIVSALSKHYLAIATMQEGKLLAETRKDIKGVNFRSSTYPKIITEGFQKFVVDLFDEIMKGDQISAGDILKHVASLEWTIFESLRNRKSTYLQTLSVKLEEEYSDPLSSQYFYYMLWHEVFEGEFPEMTIPNKCFKIPLRGGKRLFKNEAFLLRMKEKYPKIHAKLVSFLEKHPKRDLTYILIPPLRGDIPEFFCEMMDARAIISTICVPYYITLDSLGIGAVNRDENALVSDYHDPNPEHIVPLANE